MLTIKRQSTTLAYTDQGVQADHPAMVLVHGWGSDHKSLQAQAEYFSKTRRVISVDLRGHGESDAPAGEYTMAAYASDVAWICGELGLQKPMIVGHSMGGNVALELASGYPDTAGSVVLIDSVLFPSSGLLDASAPFIVALQGPGFAEAYRNGLNRLHLSTDEIAAHDDVFASLPRAPQHVLVASFVDQLMNHDIDTAAAGCKIPTAYIGSSRPMADLAKFKSLTPQVVIAQVLGAGHFSPVIVPDQINAMLDRFTKLSSLQ